MSQTKSIFLKGHSSEIEFCQTFPISCLFNQAFDNVMETTTVVEGGEFNSIREWGGCTHVSDHCFLFCPAICLTPTERKLPLNLIKEGKMIGGHTRLRDK